MLRLNLFLVIALTAVPCFAGGGQWVSHGQGWYWVNAQGHTDGVIYGGSWSGQGWVYDPIGQLAPPVVQQPQQQPQQQQPNYQPQGGYQQDDFWAEVLRQAGRQKEYEQRSAIIEKLGIRGIYGTESPNGQMDLRSMFAQRGGSGGYGSNVELPVQQGNTVYGSYDPTYNTFAEPARIPDFNVAYQTLAGLAQQQQSGSSRLASEVTTALQTHVEAARLVSETQIRAQTIVQLRQMMDARDAALLQQFNEILKANRRESIQVIPPDGGGGPPSGPPSGPPGGGPPPAGDEGGAAALYESLSTAMTTNCLPCHGGGQTVATTSGKLRMGTGTRLDVSRLSNEQWAAIFGRVQAGTMPPGGKLSSEHMSHFAKAEKFMRSGPSKAQPKPEVKPNEVDPIVPNRKPGDLLKRPSP